ncbi:MAG: DUF4097 family beta strand repeat protein [Ruminococcus sp.]|nr:DUF4097 family beta strand repeat protein [Ruminococcus sp.]
MKTAKKITAAMTAIVMLGSLGSCMSFNMGNQYANADKYTAGNRDFTEKINNIDIDWSSGSVDVEYQEGGKFSVTETSDKSLREEEQVHTWLDGDTLRIQFCKSGTVINGNVNKKLSVKIPKDTSLSSLDLDGASCEYIFDSISADSIDVDIASGDGNLKDCSAKTFKIDSSSGDLVMSQKGSADSIETDSASGGVVITAENVGTIDCGSASGKIDITASEMNSFRASTSSGTVTASLSAMPENIKISSASGDVGLTLPEKADFTLDYDTASGDLDSTLAMKKDGDNYISGSGKNKMEIDTSSGDVTIKTAS